ncbi:MAG: hypothetical protein EB833_00050 [Thaumarchaeota archaeon S13]|nr:MAG: hypothetical protein EB833_00050 [Thaumarchaeota archaeon S13]
MAKHTYTKYIGPEGMSQASPEGALFKETITMDGLDVVKSVMGPVEESDLEAWRRKNGHSPDPDEEPGRKADE